MAKRKPGLSRVLSEDKSHRFGYGRQGQIFGRKPRGKDEVVPRENYGTPAAV